MRLLVVYYKNSSDNSVILCHISSKFHKTKICRNGLKMFLGFYIIKKSIWSCNEGGTGVWYGCNPRKSCRKIKEWFLNVRQTSGQVVHRFKLWITCFCIFYDQKYFQDNAESEGECSIYSYEQICKIKKWEKTWHIYRQTIYFRYIDRLYNKEENPLIVKGLGFCFAKQGGKSSARQRARIFLRKTRRILC